MIKKRSIKAYLSLFLLILFSAAALPIDLLHHHEEEVAHCSDYGQQGHCSHKIHLSKKASFCFACAFHLDKTFLKEGSQSEQKESVWIRIFLENKVTAILLKPFITLLRGPPAQ